MLSVKPHAVKSHRLNAANKITYLGNTPSQTVTINDEINVTTAKSSSTFSSLYINVWNTRGIILHTKLKIYKAIIICMLLYTCETWTVCQCHAKKLNYFNTKCLWKLFNIK